MRRWCWLLALVACLLPEVAAAANGPAKPPAPGRPCATARAPAREMCPVTLTRGINITGWFRFPASRDPTVLGAYLSDQALADLRTAGFDFVRLAVDPDGIDTPVLIAAIRRIQRQGLTVVVSPHPHDWHLEVDPDRLLTLWRTLAPALRQLDPARTVPEVVNEPVFPHDPPGWAELQHAVLMEIRRVLPTATVMLTGQDWGSIGGLLTLAPEDDTNVIYSFHFYDPSELTSLAAYRPGLDQHALARLPFPVDDSCTAIAAQAADPSTVGLMRYYCTLGWDASHVIAPLERAAEWGRLHHVRVLAGEFGASVALNPTARLAWLATVREALQSRGIGWALWGYDDIMGFAIARPPGQRPILDKAVLAALGMMTRP